MAETNDLMQLVQEADLALIQMEQARSLVEQAKLGFEMAKEDLDRSREAYDQVIAKADELGVPRAKLKKLAEERSAALFGSGLLSTPVNAPKAPRPAKASRKLREKPALEMVPPLPEEAPSEAVLN